MTESDKNLLENFYESLDYDFDDHMNRDKMLLDFQRWLKTKDGQHETIVMYTELKAQHFEKIKEAVSEWDDDKSVRRAVEELTELSSALLQNFRGKISTDEVLKEMADVRIALAHLEIKKGNYQSHVEAKMQKCT